VEEEDRGGEDDQRDKATGEMRRMEEIRIEEEYIGREKNI
jgi:hypothetical protein